MIALFNLRFLMAILGALLLVRFCILPVIAWQNVAIDALTIEDSRLQKMRNLVNSEEHFINVVDAYGAGLASLQETLFEDVESLKLGAQTELMETFSASELSVRSFNWVLDKPGPYRTLRAKITYSGPFKDAIQMQWTLAASRRMFRIVDSRHIVTSQIKDSLGVIEGFLTLELYALSESGGVEVD